MIGQPPRDPKIFHIVHVDRLTSITRDGHLWCDAEILKRQAGGTTIGMSSIKERRLRLPVSCHPGDHVGDHVPFYFCPRSIMLFLIARANHPELSYKGGQGPIVHLEADLREAIAWADGAGRRWAFTLSNAGAAYTQFRDDLSKLDEINWTAVGASDFRSPDIKEGKQAEFLVHHCFPWHLVRRIGVQSRGTFQQVIEAIDRADHRPKVEILPAWYY